jgi:cbb3-type cytochrome oxidase subunit 3
MPQGRKDSHNPSVAFTAKMLDTPTEPFHPTGGSMKAKWTIIFAAMLLGVGSFAYSQDVKTDVDKAADKTADASKDAAKGTEHVAKKTGHGIKKGVKDVGHGVKEGAEKTGDAVK